MFVRLKHLYRHKKKLANGEVRSYTYVRDTRDPLPGKEGSPEFMAAYYEAVARLTKKKVDDYKSKIAKWTSELDGDQAQAKEFEAKVQDEEARAARYDLGEAFLQIAVVLCSVTLLTRRTAYFIFGLSIAAVGLIASASALFVH